MATRSESSAEYLRGALTRREFLGDTLLVGAALGMPIGTLELGTTPFPELKASGSPGAIGKAHGRAFAVEVKHNIGFYLDYLSRKTGSEADELLSLAHGFAAVLSAQIPEQLEEIEGIAKGARCTVDEVLLVNARTDLMVLGKRKRSQKDGDVPEETPGCTALALRETVRGKDRIALGQNWDWNRALRKNSVILRLRPKDGPRIVTFTEAGMVGKIGFNDARLGVCLNFLSHRTESVEAEHGVPVHCLLRAVMGCESVEAAVALVTGVPRCASANFLIAQAGDDGAVATDLEWAPESFSGAEMEDGVLTHTNHFKAEELGGRVTESNSCQRDARAELLGVALRKKVPDPASRMREILSMGDAEPAALSRGSTQAGVVMDLSRNELWVCAGPPHRGEWVERPGV